MVDDNMILMYGAPFAPTTPGSPGPGVDWRKITTPQPPQPDDRAWEKFLELLQTQRRLDVKALEERVEKLEKAVDTLKSVTLELVEALIAAKKSAAKKRRR